MLMLLLCDLRGLMVIMYVIYVIMGLVCIFFVMGGICVGGCVWGVYFCVYFFLWIVFLKKEVYFL